MDVRGVSTTAILAISMQQQQTTSRQTCRPLLVVCSPADISFDCSIAQLLDRASAKDDRKKIGYNDNNNRRRRENVACTLCWKLVVSFGSVVATTNLCRVC